MVNISHPNIKLSPIVGALTLAWAAANSGVAWAQTAPSRPRSISIWVAMRAMPDPAQVFIGASTTEKNGQRSSTIRNATPGKSRKRSWTRCICNRRRLSPTSAPAPAISACASPGASPRADLCRRCRARHGALSRRPCGARAFGQSHGGAGANRRCQSSDFKADSPNGPPAHHRIPPERVGEELAAAGYTLTEKFEFLPRQYGLVFTKRDS